MTRPEVIALLDPAEAAAYTVDALLHMLEMASWSMCNKLSTERPATMDEIDLASTIDRIIETTRKTHQIEMEALSAAALAFVPRGGK